MFTKSTRLLEIGCLKKQAFFLRKQKIMKNVLSFVSECDDSICFGLCVLLVFLFFLYQKKDGFFFGLYFFRNCRIAERFYLVIESGAAMNILFFILMLYKDSFYLSTFIVFPFVI